MEFSNCNLCKHSKVCKYRNDYDKFVKKFLEETFDTLETDMPKTMFDLSIQCKEYSSECTVYRRMLKGEQND